MLMLGPLWKSWVWGWVLLHSLWASVYPASIIALLASGYKEDRTHVRHFQLWSLILFLPESPCRGSQCSVSA